MEVGEGSVVRFRFVFVLEAAALYLHPFNPASMPLFLIIVHANQKNFTGIILQAIQIVLLLDLLHYYTTAEGKKQLFHIQKAPDFPTT